MSLTAVDLAWLRDEIGDATPPEDDDLNVLYATLGDRILVALRVLKRRRAGLASGASVSSFSLAGVFSVGMKAELRALDDQIARLEAAYEKQSGLTSEGAVASVSRLYRADVGLLGRSR